MPFPFEKLDGRPLVYGSIGTLQNTDSKYFQVIAEACSSLDVQLVLSLGVSGKGPSDLCDKPLLSGKSLPGDALVVSYAPQLELLSRAAVTITHAGMNTTLQSLRFGVPAVAIPLAHDQPAIAARLARTGAGFVIPPSRLTPSRLRNAVQSLLGESSEFRAHAGRVRDAILQAGGVESAADIAEQLR